jgi:hypothetical protein
VTGTSIGAPRLYNHDRCHADDNYKGDVGDVYRCPHGKIMYCFQRGGTLYGSWFGSMHTFWYTLHPLTTPIKYRRAKRALK